MPRTPLGVGVIGAGAFAHFVADSMAALPGLSLTAVCDQDRRRATHLAQLHDAAVCPDLVALLATPGLDAVVIATPPSTHAALATACLSAGVHVFCEKPAALDPADLPVIAQAQSVSGAVYAVDHVIHYNPLIWLLKRLGDAGVLEPVRRFVFENDAGDSNLGPDHWFWQPSISGGIFLEHAVHFFDVARFLINSPEQSVQSTHWLRPTGQEDTVVATVQHESGAIATHAHSFSHDNTTERQLMRLDFGYAEARLNGWIPLDLRLEMWLDDARYSTVRQVLAEPSWLALPGYRPTGGQTIRLSLLPPQASQLRTRDVTETRPHHVLLEAQLGTPEQKPQVYAESVRAALTDFAASIKSGAHPLVGLDEAGNAVRVAWAASQNEARAALSLATLAPAPAGSPVSPTRPR